MANKFWDWYCGGSSKKQQLPAGVLGVPPRAQAFRDGLADARSGRVFRHSAPPGSVNRFHLGAYDQGWEQGRAGK